MGEHARELSENYSSIGSSCFRRRRKRPCADSHLEKLPRLIGVDPGYLRRLTLEGRGPQPDVSHTGRRSYSIEDIQALRAYLDESGKADRRYLPRAARW